MRINIIYASASGNTQFVAQHIHDHLSDDFDTRIFKAELSNFKEMINSGIDHFVFATSTWEHGEINPYFNKILTEIQNLDLSKVYAAFVGTGDLRYEPILFCKGMEILRDAAITSGINELVSPLKINGDPFDQLDTLVKNWEVKLTEKLHEHNE